MTTFSRRAHGILLAAVVALLASQSGGLDAQSRDTWYLAEGATSGFFTEDILIANPNTASANIRITYLRPDGSTVVQQFAMPATSRRTVRVNDVAGVSDTAVSAIVECTNNLDILVERAMYWPDGARQGGHLAVGVSSPRRTWILAEGATGFFDEFVLLANPHPSQTAVVDVTFLTDAGQQIVQRYNVGPRSRSTIWVNQMVPGLQAANFSTVVESTTVDILAERAMYWGNFRGGHVSAAVPGPSMRWRFAEGFTGAGNGLQFDTFLLLVNSNPNPSNVRVTFFRDSGGPVVRNFTLQPTSRLNVWVDQIPELANAAFSAFVEVTSGGAITAERSVYFGAGSWWEGTNSPGATSESEAWGFADGAAGNLFSTFVLVMNDSTSPLPLRGTFMREDGTGIVRTFTVPGQARFTISPGQFPELVGHRFSTFVESIDGRPFVAEQVMYWGVPFLGGHSGGGTPWPGNIGTPPAPGGTGGGGGGGTGGGGGGTGGGGGGGTGGGGGGGGTGGGGGGTGGPYTATFPATTPLSLGNCSAAVHDRYFTVAQDGRVYRTWHPVTVPVNASNPGGAKCTFSHEHGDPPHPDAPAPPFGLASFHADMPSELLAHSGFKVFTHLRGQRTGWGNDELINVTPDWDMMLLVHQGTAGAGRLTISMHSAAFWSRDPDGRTTDVAFMADTGGLVDKAGPGGGPGPNRVVVSHADYTYEIWTFQGNVGNAFFSPVDVAVTNPMTHMHGNAANPSSVTLVSTSEEICGVNFIPCAEKRDFGTAGSFWLGNMRTLHNPNWRWSNADGPEFFCTDADGTRQPSMAACDAKVVGFIRQRVARRDFFGGASEVWDRTLNGIPGGLTPWMPMGALAGN